MARRSAGERFWEKVDKRGADECWPWLAGTDQRGYGRFDGTRASRFSWSLAHGRPFPDGLYACHTCDNPPCVNPAHIFPGTAKENTQDSLAKGRQFRGGEDRDTHCVRGHRWTEGTTHFRANGNRECRACRAEIKQEAKESLAVRERSLALSLLGVLDSNWASSREVARRAGVTAPVGTHGFRRMRDALTSMHHRGEVELRKVATRYEWRIPAPEGSEG